jgi:outer membrane lipoprotein carrier protein
VQPRPRSLGLLACLLVAACGDEQKPAGTTGPTATPPPSATVIATATATGSAAAPALPSADPATVHTAAPSAIADAGPPPDAGARPPKVAAKPDAGAAVDAGAAADAGATDAGAAPPSPALAIAQQVDAIFGAKKTFAARFKQQYTIKVTGAPKDSSGTVFIERPSKLSFRYDPPNKNRVVSDGTTIKIYMAEDNQLIETPVGKTEYPGALAFMMGNGGISRSFDFAINPRARWEGGVVLDGKPLAANPSYELAMFYIDQGLLAKSDPNALKRVLVIDAQGNKNRFDFEGVTQPDKIDPAEFTFTPPPGTDLKRQGP